MVSAGNTDRITAEKGTEIIQVPASESNIGFGIKHPFESIVLHFEFMGYPFGGVWHELHKAPGTDTGFRGRSEGTLIHDDGSDEGWPEVKLL